VCGADGCAQGSVRCGGALVGTCEVLPYRMLWAPMASLAVEAEPED
jgi:hypothetical protein